MSVFAPMGIFGPRTGTSDPFSSAAHFGIRGRALAAILTAIIAIISYALAIWTGGQAIISVANKLFGTGTGNTALAIAMGVLAVITVPVAVWDMPAWSGSQSG